MLRCAQKPRHSHLKGDISFYVYMNLFFVVCTHIYIVFGFIQVLSVTLDDWSDEEVDSMIEIGGNASANSIYEAFVPEGSSKPGPDVSHDQRLRFIRQAYSTRRQSLIFVS